MKLSTYISKKILVTAFLFGLTSFVIIKAGINFYLPGTGASTDPREIVNLLGSAITGPVGAIIIGIFSSASDNPDIRLYVILQHVITALWASIAYKKFVYDKPKMPLQILVWVFIVIVYYTIAYLPLYTFIYYFYPQLHQIFVGGNFSYKDSVIILWKGWIPEIIFTTAYTSLIVVALPDHLRKPMWGKSISAKLKKEKSSSGLSEFIISVLGRNYIWLRLSIWFILLSTIPLVFASLIVKNHLTEYLVENDGFRKKELAKVFTFQINKKGTPRTDKDQISYSSLPADSKFQIIDRKNLWRYEINDRLELNVQLKRREIEKILREKEGYLYNEQKNVVIGYSTSLNDQIVFLSSKFSITPSIEYDLITKIYKNLGITVLVISMISGLMIWFIIALPIKKLTGAANQIGKGNYDIKLDSSRMTDEIKILANTFNEMAVNIKTAEAELNEKQKELLAAKEDAEKSNRLKSEFLAQVSHEIRSPLHIIQGYLSMITEMLGDSASDKIKRGLNAVEIAGKRIMRTIHLTLNMAEIQTGTFVPHFEQLDLVKDILKQVIEENKPVAEEKNLKLELKYFMEDCKIVTDEFSMRDAFNHLLENAIKYSNKGTILVSVYKNEANEICVEVSDEGIGISEEHMKNLFKPFSQEEQGYRRQYEGNGLGLSLVKGYCDVNGIKINVESEKDVGTRFILTFGGKTEFL